ncbi:MAG: hypothetical protein H6Q89_3752 [Myxococcaceae bacterium]|nr:hypothetical protein [Myxococcaceae bacterium]
MTATVSRASQTSQSSRAQALSQERNAQLSLQQVWPYIQKYAAQYGADPKVLAAIINQESGFKNYGVHFDGTGHGLVGLDDNGLLPDFEKWSGKKFGRGANARTIPPELQIEYLAKTIGSMGKTYGSDFAAARAWHRGGGGMNDARGKHYEALIRGHIKTLFPGGETPKGGEVPDAPGPAGKSGKKGQRARPPSSAEGGGTSKAGSGYTIRKGDTLWEIASRLKSQGMPGSHWDIIHDIQKLNPKITNPNLIIAGDTIKLPGVNGKTFGSDDMSTGVGSALRDGATKIGGADRTGKDDRPTGTSNAFEIARAQLGKNAASLKLEKSALGRAMEDWVPNNVNCASFVGGCLEAAGQINHSDYSAGCTTLMANLDRNSKFKRVTLANASVGDCVTFKTPGGHHTVMFAGFKNGQPQFIGSNNVNSDGSQKITMGSMNYQLLAVHHYVG